MVALTAALTADRLYRFYHAGDDETLALRGVSLNVDSGEMVVVTGPSGSGKSTLLACLAGLDEPDGGTVWIDRKRLTRQSEEERARMRAEGIGLVFQHDNLVGHLTLAQNLQAASALGKRRAPTERALEAVGLAARARHLPHQLSGGEIARAGLAVALVNEPSVLLADEPTGELDEATTDRIVALLRERADAGAAVVVVTHDEAVARASDRHLHIVDGELTR